MNYGELLSRSWQIVWNNKYLFVLGFLAALGSGGSSGSSNVNYTIDAGEVPPGFDLRLERFLDVFWPFLAGLVCVVLLVVIVLWLVRLTAQAGLISAAARIDAGEKVSFGQAISAGASKLGRMVGINVIMFGPFALVGFIVLAAAIAMASAAIGYESGYITEGIEAVLGSLAVLIVCASLLLCILVPVLLFVMVIYPFAQRAAVLHDYGVTASISHGWWVVKRNPAKVIILILIFIALGIGFLMASALIALPILLVGFVPSMVDLIVQGTFSAGDLVALGGSAICLGLIVAAINSVLVAFRSTTVTLAYQQFEEKKA